MEKWTPLSYCLSPFKASEVRHNYKNHINKFLALSHSIFEQNFYNMLEQESLHLFRFKKRDVMLMVEVLGWNDVPDRSKSATRLQIFNILQYFHRSWHHHGTAKIQKYYLEACVADF